MIDAIVRVVFRKYDGSLHWHNTMRRLGEDAHGVWLGAPAGLISRKGEHGPPVVAEFAQVLLVPRDDWWVAAFNASPAPNEVYVDITTRPAWPSPDEVTMVDLDLDVLRFRTDGSVEIVDQDEFAEHQIHYAYPPDIVEEAEKAADRLHGILSDGMEPFATGYRTWLTMVS